MFQTKHLLHRKGISKICPNFVMEMAKNSISGNDVSFDHVNPQHHLCFFGCDPISYFKEIKDNSFLNDSQQDLYYPSNSKYQCLLWPNVNIMNHDIVANWSVINCDQHGNDIQDYHYQSFAWDDKTVKYDYIKVMWSQKRSKQNWWFQPQW